MLSIEGQLQAPKTAIQLSFLHVKLVLSFAYGVGGDIIDPSRKILENIFYPLDCNLKKYSINVEKGIQDVLVCLLLLLLYSVPCDVLQQMEVAASMDSCCATDFTAFIFLFLLPLRPSLLSYQCG